LIRRSQAFLKCGLRNSDCGFDEEFNLTKTARLEASGFNNPKSAIRNPKSK